MPILTAKIHNIGERRSSPGNFYAKNHEAKHTLRALFQASVKIQDVTGGGKKHCKMSNEKCPRKAVKYKNKAVSVVHEHTVYDLFLRE